MVLQRALQASALWAFVAAVVRGAIQFVAACALLLGGGNAVGIVFACSISLESGLARPCTLVRSLMQALSRWIPSM